MGQTFADKQQVPNLSPRPHCSTGVPAKICRSGLRQERKLWAPLRSGKNLKSRRMLHKQPSKQLNLSLQRNSSGNPLPQSKRARKH